MLFDDYAYYKLDYRAGSKAVIGSTDFPFYAKKACSVIDQYTFGRIDLLQMPEEKQNLIKNAVCEVAEILYNNDAVSHDIGGITSEKTGDLSVSYASASDRDAEEKKQIRAAIYRNIANTGLLYSGV